MRMTTRFIVALLAVFAVMAVALAPLVDGLITRWFEHDVEARSQLVFNSIQDTLTELIARGDGPAIRALFDHIALDERLLALGYCTADGVLLYAGAKMPRDFTCAPVDAHEDPAFAIDRGPTGRRLIGGFPLAPADAGRLVVLHDLGFIETRSTRVLLYLVGALIVLAGLISAATVLVARFTLRDWLKVVRASLQPPVPGTPPPQTAPPDMAPVVREIRQLLRALESDRGLGDDGRQSWSPESLAGILQQDLAGSQVIVVSNREPYSHEHGAEGITVERPASGLVSALEPVTRACAGTWIAYGSGDADRETVDAHDRLAVPPDDPAYTLRRVWLDEDELEGFYYGFANEGLWPLCHLAFVRPVFREGDWQRYVAVNRKFADAVLAEAHDPQPIVLVQDYHFALLPRMIRERLPEATIVTFWHIPWPNAEAFGICPWREELLRGLLGSTILGFHTQFHCNNFLATVDRCLESRIDHEESTVRHRGDTTLVRRYPISIEWPPSALVRQLPVDACRRAVCAQLGLPEDIRLGVGVERFDYTKGILDRFLAVQALLEREPRWIGRFTFVQIAAPTRSKLPAYRQLQDEAEALAAEINARFGREGYRPIELLAEHHGPEDVFRLFRAADVCVVSSLHDGMNLVAKEFVAAREDEQGVLILSTFAGASRELLEALLVNPYDAAGMSRALHEALTMPPEEQRERMRLMRAMVQENNVYRWAGRMLLDAARHRKRNHLLGRMAAVAPER